MLGGDGNNLSENAERIVTLTSDYFARSGFLGRGLEKPSATVLQTHCSMSLFLLFLWSKCLSLSQSLFFTH